jgi:hypothetical protein
MSSDFEVSQCTFGDAAPELGDPSIQCLSRFRALITLSIVQLYVFHAACVKCVFEGFVRASQIDCGR